MDVFACEGNYAFCVAEKHSLGLHPALYFPEDDFTSMIYPSPAIDQKHEDAMSGHTATILHQQ